MGLVGSVAALRNASTLDELEVVSAQLARIRAAIIFIFVVLEIVLLAMSVGGGNSVVRYISLGVGLATFGATVALYRDLQPRTIVVYTVAMLLKVVILLVSLVVALGSADTDEEQKRALGTIISSAVVALLYLYFAWLGVILWTLLHNFRSTAQSPA